MPEDAPQAGIRVGAAVEPIAKGRAAAARRIVKGNRPFEMAPCKGEVAEPEQRVADIAKCA